MLVGISADIIYYNSSERSSNIIFTNFLTNGNILDTEALSGQDNLIGNDRSRSVSNKPKVNNIPDTLSSLPKANEKNILFIFNMFKNKIERIFHSSSRILDMQTIGKNENFIITCRQDGYFDIYDIKKFDEIYFNYKVSEVNITRQKSLVNVKNEEEKNPEISNNEGRNNNDIKICLPIFSSFENFESENIIKMENEIIKIIKKTNNKNDSIRLYAIDKNGNILVLIPLINSADRKSGNSISGGNTNINNKNSYYLSSKNLLKKLYEIKISEKLKNMLENKELKCYDIKEFKNEDYERENNVGNPFNKNYQDVFFINTNLGLIKLSLLGKNDFNLRIVYNNFTEKNILTAFDISDTGLILAAFSDLTVKVIEIEDFSCIFQVYVPCESLDTVIDKIFWASIICKDDRKKLIRKSLIANFFATNSKNEFIIYDLNQPNKSDSLKIKKKIDLGSKRKLNRINSLIDFS